MKTIFILFSVCLISSCLTNTSNNYEDIEVGSLSSDDYKDIDADSLLLKLELEKIDYQFRDGAGHYDISEEHFGDTLRVKYALDIKSKGKLKSKIYLTPNNNFKILVENDLNSMTKNVEQGIYGLTFYLRDNKDRIIQEFIYDVK